MLAVDRPPLAGERAVEVVAGVDLDAGLIGEDLHPPAAGRVLENRRRPQHPIGLPATEHVVVVDAAGIGAVGTRRQGVDRGGKHPGRLALGAEVERCSLHLGKLAGGDAAVVDRKVGVGIHREPLRADVARRLPGHVPVGMMDHVDDRRSIGRGRQVDDQFAGGVERVDDLRRELSRIALLAVGRDGRELERRAVAGEMRDGLPEMLVEAQLAAVKVVSAVVGGKRVSLAVEIEGPLGDPVRDPPAGGTEIRMPLGIGLHRIEAEDNIDRRSARFLGRDMERCEDSAILTHRGLPATGHFERPEVDGAAVGEGAKRLGDRRVHGGRTSLGWLRIGGPSSSPEEHSHDPDGGKDGEPRHDWFPPDGRCEETSSADAPRRKSIVRDRRPSWQRCGRLTPGGSASRSPAASGRGPRPRPRPDGG